MFKSEYLKKSKKYKGFHYSVLDSSDFDRLHKRTLCMFKQVKEIFDRNQIKYMLCGGTLLGALGGGNGAFIPWDDDFDICIFEDDYSRAIECLTDEQNGLSNGMVLQCKETDPNYYLGWMKVRDQQSHTYPDAPKFKENGVWIDIYKLRKVDELDVPLLIANEEVDYLKRRLEVGGLSLRDYEKRITSGMLLEKLDNARKQREEHPENSQRTVYIIWSASKIVLESDWIEPLRNIHFEGLEVTTFGKAEEYLKRHYGESYMELPPDEMRSVGINRIEWK